MLDVPMRLSNCSQLSSLAIHNNLMQPPIPKGIKEFLKKDGYANISISNNPCVESKELQEIAHNYFLTNFPYKAVLLEKGF